MGFLDGIGKRMNQAVRSVQEITRESVETGRIAADLRAARTELERCYQELGRAYYEAVENGTGEVAQELIDRVTDTLAKIEAIDARRDRAHAQIRCPGCGNMQPENVRFCSNCGRRMPEETPPAPEPMPEDEEYCPECGAMRQGDSKYCSICGCAFIGRDAAVPVPASERREAEEPPLEEPETAENYGE